MLVNLLNRLLKCSHRQLSRVFTPRGAGAGEAYVSCLDCGQRLPYDLEGMRLR